MDRHFILVDNNPQALVTMAERFRGNNEIEWINYDPQKDTP
jgi:hypothetical protein